MKSDRRVVLGLSGGVDSAVAARLLQRDGYEVLGLYLDAGDPSARADAEATAAFLGVDLRVCDIREALEAQVCQPFAKAYLRGETPNPCILCNPKVKFRALCDDADARGAAFIATGHYARAKDGMLFRGEPANDQSYMLCRLTREQARRLLLPLGGMEKARVRALAAEFDLPVARKPDSMEICFIPDRDYAGWLARRGAVPGPGRVLFRGETVGRHEGVHRWTVGQRLPGLYDGRKLYVAAIAPEKNALVAALWEDLFRTRFRVHDLSWLIDPPVAPLRCSVRVRHTKWENPDCTVLPDADGASVVADSPVRAPAPGQAAAFYQGERLVGGGWIARESEEGQPEEWIEGKDRA